MYLLFVINFVITSTKSWNFSTNNFVLPRYIIQSVIVYTSEVYYQYWIETHVTK